MLATVHSATLLGVEGQLVAVEVHVANGLPGYTVVGLPDAAGRESRERVRAALLSSDIEWPNSGSPSTSRPPRCARPAPASSSRSRSRSCSARTSSRPGASTASASSASSASTAPSARCPARSCSPTRSPAPASRPCSSRPRTTREAALVPGPARPQRTEPRELRECLKGEAPVARSRPARRPTPPTRRTRSSRTARPRRGPRPRHRPARARDRGRRRAPPAPHRPARLRQDDARPPAADDPAAARSRRGGRGHPDRVGRRRPPARPPRRRAPVPRAAPHRHAHRRSSAAGSGRPRPGEVTLAHRGVLFLDELGEFPPVALDALRQPLEEGVVRIARQGASLVFPASFVLVGCTNPCPCGRVATECRCSDFARARYLRRLQRAAARPLRPPAAHHRPVRPRSARRVLGGRRRAGRGRGRPAAAAAAGHAVALEPRDPGRLHRPVRRAHRRRGRRVAVRGRGRPPHRPRRGPHPAGRAHHRRPRRHRAVEAEHVVLAASLRQDVP